MIVPILVQAIHAVLLEHGPSLTLGFDLAERAIVYVQVRCFYHHGRFIGDHILNYVLPEREGDLLQLVKEKESIVAIQISEGAVLEHQVPLELLLVFAVKLYQVCVTIEILLRDRGHGLLGEGVDLGGIIREERDIPEDHVHGVRVEELEVLDLGKVKVHDVSSDIELEEGVSDLDELLEKPEVVKVHQTPYNS